MTMAFRVASVSLKTIAVVEEISSAEVFESPSKFERLRNLFEPG